MDGFALAYMGAGIGLGLAVIGAGLGIGRLAAGLAEGIARQPSAVAQLTGAVNLPLFLLEGVAILAEVFALLIVLDRKSTRLNSSHGYISYAVFCLQKQKRLSARPQRRSRRSRRRVRRQT